MFAASGRHVLDEHKRAEIAGRYYSSANLDSRFKCSYAGLAREYGVSKSTIRYICKEFSDPYMKTRAIAAAESITEAIRVQPSLAQARLPKEAKRRFQICIPPIHVLSGTPLQLGCLLPLQPPESPNVVMKLSVACLQYFAFRVIYRRHRVVAPV